MESVHSKYWVCSVQGHQTQPFRSEKQFIDHMHSSHDGDFADSHLPMWVRRAERAGVAFTTCPLCESGPEVVVTGSGTEMDRLVGHVANHLRHLALISLPWDDQADDAENQATASNKSNKANENTVQDLLEEVPSLSFESDSAALTEDEWPTTQAQDIKDDPTTAEDELPNEWGFVEYFTPYQGHDRDPTLQTFLRKWYLESSPTPTQVKGPTLPCVHIPFSRNDEFFGRDSILELTAEALVPSASRSSPADTITFPRTFTLYGPGGMGKTQVAVEFVHRYRHEFDAILWAHADDASKLAHDFNTMALELGLVSKDSVDAQDQIYTRELVKRWLVDPLKDIKDGTVRASWLLVFDSVNDGKLLNNFWPYDGPGSILITSRSPFSWTTSLPLVPFSVREATEYLLRLTKRGHSDQQHAEDVSHKLGGLPLAL